MFTNIIEKVTDFFCDRIFGWWKKLRYDRLVTSLQHDLEIFQEIEILLEKTGCDRINFIYMHNGGGSIVPGKTKFVSVIFEKIKSGIPSRKDDFQRVVVGDSYLYSVVNMLFDKKRMILKQTEELPDSKLKNVYSIDKIKSSIIAYIGSNLDNIWYLSLNFKDKKDSINLEEVHSISSSRERIANILEKYFTLTDRA